MACLLKKYCPELQVSIFEREAFPRDHIGESQLPVIMGILNEMGVWDKVEAAGFPVKLGGTYRWGATDELWHLNFIPPESFVPSERPARLEGQRSLTAFQVDRSIFDKILLDHAAEMGCQIFQQSSVKQVETIKDSISALKIVPNEGKAYEVTAKFYVDASGDAGVLRKALNVGTEMPTGLRNIAFWDYWQDADWAETLGGAATRIQVMSLGWGWLWFIPITPHRTSIGLVLPADYYKKTGKKPEELYLEAVKSDPLIAELTKHATRENRFEATKDWNFVADRLAGENWFLVGDTCGFADPILSAGMTLAHTSARKAAYSILELHQYNPPAEWIKNQYSEAHRAQIKRHMRFAEFWYAGNGCFTDLKAFCSEIAQTAGLNLGPDQAFRWLGTGGFAEDYTPGFPGAATFPMSGVRKMASSIAGGEIQSVLADCHEVRLNMEGTRTEPYAVYDSGRVFSIPCLIRGEARLPIAGLFEIVLRNLPATTDPDQLMKLCLAEAKRDWEFQEGSSFNRDQFVETLEALIIDGWVVAKRDPTRYSAQTTGSIAQRQTELLRQAFNKGDFNQTINLAEQRLEQNPVDPEAKLLLGISLIRLRKTPRGIDVLEALVSELPEQFDALNWLSFAYLSLGRFLEAIDPAAQASKLNPHSPDAFKNLGTALINSGRFAEAASAFETASELEPREVAHLYHLGHALAKLNRVPEALAAFERAEKRSNNPRQHLMQSLSLLEGLAKWSESRSVAAKLIALDPKDPTGYASLGLAEINLGMEPGLVHLQRAFDIAPAAYRIRFALALQRLGKFAEAEDLLTEALRSNSPDSRQALLALATNGTDLRKYPEFAATAEEILSGGKVSPPDASALHFALGKLSDQQGHFERAISHFDMGNSILYDISKRIPNFLVDDYKQFIHRLPQTYLHLKESVPKDFAISSEPFVFVVGMMRSGTTLMHQILTATPHFAGVGELGFFYEDGSIHGDLLKGQVDVKTLIEVSSRYCIKAEAITAGKGRMVDKYPGNYTTLGLIHLAFPNAKFVHMKRDPLDTCLSIWMMSAALRQPWGHDRSNIVAAYQAYQEVMAQWKNLLPKDVILDVSYEELATKPEEVTRQVADFLGVEWTPDFLHHENNQGTILTPSMWQARQPIYSSSVGRSNNYRRWLGEFLTLSPAGLETGTGKSL